MGIALLSRQFENWFDKCFCQVQPPERVFLIDTNVILCYLLNDHQSFNPKAKGLKKAGLQLVVVVKCVYVMEKFYEIPKNEIVDKLSRILNIKGIVNPDKSEILAALVKYENSNADILDCMLAAKSFPHRVILSFDKDFKKEKAMEEKITYRRPDEKECNAYYAIPAAGETAPGVVVLQEWWGLNDQIKGVADRLTEVGYRALVPDLYRGKVTLEAAEAEHLMRNLDFGDAATQDIRGAVQYLKGTSPRVAVIGFCMGSATKPVSTMTLR